MGKLSLELKIFFGGAAVLLIIWTVVTYLCNGSVQETASVVQTLAIFLGGLFALFRYIKHRDDEVTLKVLNEVYAPLYAFIVRNDTFCYVAGKHMPFLSVSLRETKMNYNSKTGEFSQEKGQRIPVEGMSIEKDLLAVCDNVNFGLAPYELVTLLNMYKVVYLSTKDFNHNSEQVPGLICSNMREERRWLLRHRVELALRKSIIEGYIKYSKKTGPFGNDQELFKIINERIEITEHDPKDKEALLEEFKKFSFSPEDIDDTIKYWNEHQRRP